MYEMRCDDILQMYTKYTQLNVEMETPYLPTHPALEVTTLQLTPASTDFQTSFAKVPATLPPMTRITSPGRTRLLCAQRAIPSATAI